MVECVSDSSVRLSQTARRRPLSQLMGWRSTVGGYPMHPSNEHSWWRYGWLSRAVACHPPRLCYSCSLLHIPLEQTFNSPYALVHVFSHQNVWSHSQHILPHSWVLLWCMLCGI